MPRPVGGPGPQVLSEEDKASAPKVTKAFLGRIFSYLKPYWLQFVLVFAVIIVSAVLGLVPSIVTGRIVDEALVGEDLRFLVQLLLIALVAMLASQLIGVLENYINAWISQRIIYDMRNEMYTHLQSMPHSFFTTEKQGDIITRMDTDISGVSSVISGTLSKAVGNLATVITTLVAMFTMSWQLALVGLAVVPLLILPTRSAGKARLKYATLTQAATDDMNQIINESLSVSGSLLVKMFTREEAEFEKFNEANEKVTNLSMKETRSGALFSIAMGMFMQLGPLLLYFAGGLLIIQKLDPALTVGTVTAMVALVNRLYRPVESLLNLQVSFTRSLALFNRIFDYLDRPNTITSPENGAKPVVDQQPIEYEHVAFSYNSENQILTDVNFTVPGGTMYAIVGPSGSGKSTVVNLIPRLYDVDAGSVKIAGVDVRDFDLAYLREQIGMVTQEAYLFNGTILENLQYAKEDATIEEIEQACKIANIHDYIASQPQGYNTQVGNRGLKLSGGEKQRLSLARVILKDPKILILDEATSALDSISEAAIQQALEQLMVGRTSIVIAHRLSTILKADCIMVVADGVIAEMGSHEELLAQNGIYTELFNTQFSQVLGDASAAMRVPEAQDNKAQGGALASRVPEAGTPEANGSRVDGPAVGDPEAAGMQAARMAGVPVLDIQALGTDYNVRRLTEADIADVYLLARSNRRYYRSLHIHPTRTMLTEVISNVPEGAGPNSKHCVGFFDGEDLVAVLDLICGYPEPDDAFIGWFMVAADLQGQGIGSQIFADVRAAMQAQGYDYLQVVAPAANDDAINFWKSQGFAQTGEVDDAGDYPTITLSRSI